MDRAPERRDRAGRVGGQAVLLKQAAGVVGGRAEGDVDPLAQVGVDVAAVALQIRDDLDRGLALQLPAHARGPQHPGEVMGAAGQEERPRFCGSRPVALATAAISMADLVPSTKLLNILGFMPAACGLGRGDAEMLPHRRRRRLVEMRQVAGALAGADHGEAEARAQSTSSQISAGWSP